MSAARKGRLVPVVDGRSGVLTTGRSEDSAGPWSLSVTPCSYRGLLSKHPQAGRFQTTDRNCLTVPEATSPLCRWGRATLPPKAPAAAVPASSVCRGPSVPWLVAASLWALPLWSRGLLLRMLLPLSRTIQIERPVVNGFRAHPGNRGWCLPRPLSSAPSAGLLFPRKVTVTGSGPLVMDISFPGPAFGPRHAPCRAGAPHGAGTPVWCSP